ncbi:hypothetical protein AB7M17_004260 [Bradyrhizobium sp. USDA 377]
MSLVARGCLYEVCFLKGTRAGPCKLVKAAFDP